MTFDSRASSGTRMVSIGFLPIPIVEGWRLSVEAVYQTLDETGDRKCLLVAQDVFEEGEMDVELEKLYAGSNAPISSFFVRRWLHALRTVPTPDAVALPSRRVLRVAVDAPSDASPALARRPVGMGSQDRPTACAPPWTLSGRHTGLESFNPAGYGEPPGCPQMLHGTADCNSLFFLT
jgi:hypothetical protein